MAEAGSPVARPYVLYITYNGLLEPLGQSQGLAYVERLSGEYRFTILSFEKPRTLQAPTVEAMQRRLGDADIDWIPLRYHKRPSTAATVFDVLNGIAMALRMHRRRGFSLLHARGYVPAAIARGVQRLTAVPFIFDIRGLQAEEYVDGGIWREGSPLVRVTKAVERDLLRSASGVVTLTDAIRPHLAERIRSTRGDLPPWCVVPCCVDLDRFRPDAAVRASVRGALGLGHRPVLVYAGSVGTWYLLEEMIAYFRAAKEHVSGLALLLLVNGTADHVRSVAARAGLGSDDYRQVTAGPEEVPGYLAAADAGIAFIRPCFSKKASSPTKVGEYLATGLPVVLNSGIGDSDRLQDTGVVQLVRDLSAGGIERAAAQLPGLLSRPAAEARNAAAARFDIDAVAVPRYRELYRAVLPDGAGR